jgi:hypothetical protein
LRPLSPVHHGELFGAWQISSQICHRTSYNHFDTFDIVVLILKIGAEFHAAAKKCRFTALSRFDWLEIITYILLDGAHQGLFARADSGDGRSCFGTDRPGSRKLGASG